MLLDREQVGEHLTGMEVIGECIDDGDIHPLGYLLDLLLLERADHDGIHEALEHQRGVLDRLTT